MRRQAILLIVTFVATLSSRLQAEEPPQIVVEEPTPPPPKPAPVEPAPAEPAPEAPHDEEPASRPHVAVRFNPLNLLFGRVSGDVEVWPIPQLSIVGTPWRVGGYDQSAETGDKGEQTRAHLELTGVEFAARVWPLYKRLGPVTLAPFGGLNAGGSWGTLHTSVTSGSYTSSSSDYVDPIHQIILAGEVGVALYRAPFMVQAGLGAQWTHSQGRDPSGPTFWDCMWVCTDNIHFAYGNGFLPRLLFSAGLAL
jgi:hypothetical protein